MTPFSRVNCYAYLLYFLMFISVPNLKRVFPSIPKILTSAQVSYYHSIVTIILHYARWQHKNKKNTAVKMKMAVSCILSEIKRDIGGKSRCLHTPPEPRWGASEYRHNVWYEKTRMVRLGSPKVKKI